ncbi:MAG: MBL fold metallo-hydrolase [Clostridiales bacterium]|nr:MBL fold metallo-hydrolase [Clostridiales bacterium]
MLKRILVLLLMLVMFVPAFAEENARPVVINRVDDLEAHADFAFAEDAELLQITFPQMVDCDAVLLRCGGETMLVDACKQAYSERIVNLCKQLGVTRIDRVVNTHPHEDHIGGFKDVIKEIEVGEFWICFPEDYNNHMTAAVKAANKAGIPVKTYTDGDVFTLGGATIEVWKLEGKIGEMNDCSAQMMVTFGERTMLLAADLQQDGQQKMVELHGEALDADILKYPHHGIEVLRDDYMAAVSPLFLVVTNNHRQTAGWKWITSGKAGVPYAYTVPNLVHLTTDGTAWIAEKIPSAVKY